jgi:uncharacterized protein
MENLTSVLKKIEEAKNIKILFACETGSRAWGFPSPDSDFDIRFLYKHHKNCYLSLSTKKDTIEFMDNDLDITGWDLKKSLLLLKKSNVPLIERFQSPIVYFDKNNFKAEFKELVEDYYSPIAAFFHHHSLVKNFWEELKDKKEIKLKSYFYLIRSILSCNWIVTTDKLLPMDIENLMTLIDEDIKDRLRRLIQLKSTVGEKYFHPKEDYLNKWIVSLLDQLEDRKHNLKVCKTDIKRADEFFLKKI